jgi:hypothetical protein
MDNILHWRRQSPRRLNLLFLWVDAWVIGAVMVFGAMKKNVVDVSLDSMHGNKVALICAVNKYSPVDGRKRCRTTFTAVDT